MWIKRSTGFVAVLCLIAGMLLVAPHGSAAPDDDLNLKQKAKRVKRIVRKAVMPSRPIIATPRTGQITSYLPWDDGDLQKGMAWPEPRFVDRKDGTVIDRLTGLMWLKDPRQVPQELHWKEAVGTCSALCFAGYDNWRLPNINELQSLVDYGRHDPSLSDGHPFLGIQVEGSYWSSTTVSSQPKEAWAVELRTGRATQSHKSQNALHVWPVRLGRQATW